MQYPPAVTDIKVSGRLDMEPLISWNSNPHAGSSIDHRVVVDGEIAMVGDTLYGLR